MKRNLQKLFVLLLMFISANAVAQNQVYWREGFEPSATPACDLGTVAPTATGGNYFNGNAGSWYGFNVYRTTGTGCPAGNNHVRFKNISGVTDSGYLVTPVVDFGIKELHFYRARANRLHTIWVTSDTSATTTNWTYVTSNPKSTSTGTCNDTTFMINAANAKRLKIVSVPGTDTDVDSIWITSVGVITPVKFGSFAGSYANGLVKLNWNIESELNTLNYTIERSSIADNFYSIGNVKANKLGNYSWVDNAASDVNYYRIKAIDKNGDAMYSNIIKVVAGKVKAEMNVFPNPVNNNHVNVQLTGISKGNYTINIYNLKGSLVYSANVYSEGTSMSKTLDFPTAISNGYYNLEVTNANFKSVKTILVK